MDDAAALEAAQDRLAEKTFLNEAGIPTARFRAVDSQDDLDAALAGFGGEGVLKTRRFGYDGKGQRVFRKGDAAAGAYADLGGVPLILESLVFFEREISIIAARGIDGAVVAYDPAENLHRGGILSTSTVPARVSAAAVERARSAAGAILERLDYVGVIGIEFFVLADGELVANEFAPRVHNSGHWTEAACAVSQFENHIRAVCGLPLAPTGRHSDCVMHNIVGEEMASVPQLLTQSGLVLHLYGKSEMRPGRKMGHYTVLHRRAEG
jgi:5-(carboxyamino)imidazole ribonucleotide synthase